jgi:DNA polymerase I-like protein with 3'-5' exonuclease and polymerase domains
MLINADAKGLEWVCAVFSSQDPTGLREILNEEDQHADNQQQFNLPDRRTAKFFLFRIIFGGSAPGFAKDFHFAQHGGAKFWDGVVERFYEKYRGIQAWHSDLVVQATTTQQVRTVTGRTYQFDPRDLIHNLGRIRPKILNYPVQGLGADLMMIARYNLWNLLQQEKVDTNLVRLTNTVHDSIILDVPDDMWYNISTIVKKAFETVPETFESLYSTKFNLPMRAEITYGPDWQNQQEVQFND